MVAERIVLLGAVCAASLLALGRTFTDRLKERRGVGFCHCEPGWGRMGASVTLRWRVSGVDCELQMQGATGEVCLRRDGKVIASATVPSAAAAYDWAAQQADILGEESRRDRRTGSD
jgi:hypothetical protein